MKWVQLFTGRQRGRGDKRAGFSLYKMICEELLLWVRLTRNVHESGASHRFLQTLWHFVLGKNSDVFVFSALFFEVSFYSGGCVQIVII